ncbi:MAG: hypothetical protein NT039_00485 [Candidatus Berkelbacteria bacterium]|nr:hypothetical protein [Candidatus Berkelbacteria bacterium]
MKIFICCSTYLYPQVLPIKKQLEAMGHKVALPNSFLKPLKEEKLKKQDRKEHIRWKRKMIRRQNKKVEANDAILVLNLDKKGQKNYIGGATFLEIFRAFDLKKKIFLYNPIPKSIFEDELKAMVTEVIKGDLSKIK